MTRGHALVVHTRMPAFDRDSGSQDIDNTVRFLLRAGWQVTYLAREEQGVAEERHAQRLRQLGVATHAGFGGAERILRSNDFDLALIAFWELAAELLPLVRDHAPGCRVVINSIDIHFLRNARRSFRQGAMLGGEFGTETVKELNAYDSADAVIAVSDKEREFLADFLGPERVHALPLAEDVAHSPYPLSQRRGMYFVGNFRHLPNREAVEYLCAEVLPLLDPELLERHPLTVLGNWLDQVTLDIDPAHPGIQLVGWVPSVRPYIEHSRVGVVPLLYGAGVKRKVIQSMMAGTPVVTTPVGAEGLDLVQGVHALIGADTADLAAGITRLLTDDALWHRLAVAGATHVDARHGLEVVEQRFSTIVEEVMRRDPARIRLGSSRLEELDADREAAGRRIQLLGRPGEVVLVACGAGDEMLEAASHRCWPFPQGREESDFGYDPVDGDAAVNHLEAQRARGARYFVLPRHTFGWRNLYPELFQHLDGTARRVHHDEHLVAYDLVGNDDGPLLAPTPTARVLVVGTYPADRTGPRPDLMTELSASTRLTVEQVWSAANASEAHALESLDTRTVDADYVVFVRDDAILPTSFLDTLLATQATLGVDRLQPAHTDGPTAGPPVTERHFGTVAREVGAVTPLPVLSVRAGAAATGPVTLADSITVGIRRPLPRDVDTHDEAAGCVRRAWVAGPGHAPEVFDRPEPATLPRISVLIATFERPELMRSCLSSFADQTIDRHDFEVVVVDDGSDGDNLAKVLDEFVDNLQVVGLRIEHAGRSAAKNHAVLLARAPIVLFFDDDDRAQPDYLERHLAGHVAHPHEGTSILGHTDWAPELEATPLMHYITDVDRLMFAYERLGDGQVLDWRGFWEGRISCKRSLLLRHGLHDQRLNYSIDVEMAWRLSPAGLRVVYDSSARSLMARPIDFDAFCERSRAKGRAHAIIAALHSGTEIASRLKLGDAARLWEERHATEVDLRKRVAALEIRCLTDDSALSELHRAYRDAFRLLNAKGVATMNEGAPTVAEKPTTVTPLSHSDPELVHDGSPADSSAEPRLSITIPVWSRSPQLAAMARATIERIWEVARVPTEVVVVDNGSPYEIPLPAKVYRYDENRGVSVGWNTGIRLSTASVFVVLNSDCRVEPGWDEALYEAAADGRRIAFPYTDHCDGLGFTRPDQAGTAGWCFMMTRAVYDEVGPFDEWFSPAYCEDTDYWHRAWELGIELSPVPAARVVHSRRTSASTGADLLLQAHRFKYGWKHNVDPLRAPPYYNREFGDYEGAQSPPGAERR